MPPETTGSAGQDRIPTTAAREMVPCPECDNGRVFATFTYTNGDTADVPAECPYCGGLGTALRGAVERDYA